MNNVRLIKILCIFFILILMLSGCSYDKNININPKNKAECLEQANSYLNSGDFSKEGLKSQLAYHGYYISAINYAIENCNANYAQECADWVLNFGFKEDKEITSTDLKIHLKLKKFTNEDITMALIILTDDYLIENSTNRLANVLFVIEELSK